MGQVGQGRYHLHLGIEINSIEYRDNTLQLVFQMQVHNIGRKYKILETIPKSKEIINFYLIFLYILVFLWQFISEEMSMFCFHKFYFI